MPKCPAVFRKLNRKICILIFCLLLPAILAPLAASPHKESKCAFVMILVAAYWMLEPVPIAATALLPVVLFPMMGVVSSAEVCQNYMKETFMMFIGGLVVAIAVEDCRLHERIALKVLLVIGTGIQWLMLGFMLTTMFLSMWISNTATTAMMVPIVDAVIREISTNSDKDHHPPDAVELNTIKDSTAKTSQNAHITEENNCQQNSTHVTVVGGDVEPSSSSRPSTLKLALLLSICYSANIGGTGTLTGTGPNLVFKGLMDDLYPKSGDITFASWIIYNIPGMVLCVLIGWTYLWLIYVRCSKAAHNLESKESIKLIISKRYADLGSLTFHESSVLCLFVVLVALWIFRDPKFIDGWAVALNSDTKIGDSVPAIAIAFLLFFVPRNIKQIRKPLLEWKVAQAKLPWGVIILIGGGFALADAAKKSGLSDLLAQKLTTLQVLSPGAIAAIICFMTAMLTEIISNTTAATILLPVIGQMAESIGVNPLFLMLPVAVTCSYAFMLPVATPPNAIAFESGRMRTIDMVKPGFVMNLVCCGVQLFMINTLGVAMFDLNKFPSWANSSFVNTSTINYASNATLMENSTTSSLLSLTTVQGL